MSASMLMNAEQPTSIHTSTISQTRKGASLKSIDQLITRYNIFLQYEQGSLVEYPFQEPNYKED